MLKRARRVSGGRLPPGSVGWRQGVKRIELIHAEYEPMDGCIYIGVKATLFALSYRICY